MNSHIYKQNSYDESKREISKENTNVGCVNKRNIKKLKNEPLKIN